jgi:hypothetical protein
MAKQGKAKQAAQQRATGVHACRLSPSPRFLTPQRPRLTARPSPLARRPTGCWTAGEAEAARREEEPQLQLRGSILVRTLCVVRCTHAAALCCAAGVAVLTATTGQACRIHIWALSPCRAASPARTAILRRRWPPQRKRHGARHCPVQSAFPCRARRAAINVRPVLDLLWIHCGRVVLVCSLVGLHLYRARDTTARLNRACVTLCRV